MSRNYIKNCPHCSFDLDDGDIYERFLEKYSDAEKALQIAQDDYGYSETNKGRFSKIVGCMSLEEDRVTHWICPQCEKKIDNPWEGYGNMDTSK